MTFIGIKATAIQAIFEYTRKKATLFFKYTRKKATLFLKYTRKKATLFLKYARKKATLFYRETHLHPLFTTILQVPIEFVLLKDQYEVMIQNIIYRIILHLLKFWMKSDLY